MDGYLTQVAREHLAVLARLDDLLQSNGVAYLLFGGWAVDFHAGAVTRTHRDIDLAVWWNDRARVAALLATDAWAHARRGGAAGPRNRR